MREKLLLQLTGFKEAQVRSLQLSQCAHAQGEPELVLVSHTVTLLFSC